MFLGAHIRKLDNNGRVRLPNSFLDEMKKTTMYLFSIGINRIALFPSPQWEKITKKVYSVAKKYDNLKLRRATLRAVFPYSFEIESDYRGRITIPEVIRRESHLTENVLLLGLVNRVELWDPNEFNKLGEGKIEEYPLFMPEELAKAYGEEAFTLMSHLILAYKRNVGPYKSSTDKGAKHLFLCHSSKDKKFVRHLVRDLTREGITVWFDEWEMLPGDSLYEKIQGGIKQASWFGIILSPDSVQSQWCKRELYNALEEEFKRNKIFVIPILYRDCDIPGFLKEKVYVDLRKGHYEKEFTYLLRRFDM